MRFHGVEMVGKHLMQEVDTGVDTNYEARRLVYDNGSMYYGNDSKWVNASGFPAGTIMWFYDTAPPTGWTIVDAIADDTCLGVRSSGGTYTTGGTLKGSWSTGWSHNHSDGSLSVLNHNHQWLNIVSGNDETYDSGGSTDGLNGDGSSADRGIVTRADGDQVHGDNAYTKDSTAGVSGSTGTDTMSTARPYVYTGVLGTKD